MVSRVQASAAREAEIDEVIAEFGGDARAAISALLWDIEALARDREANTSFGFTRGQVAVYARKHCTALGRVEGDIRVEAWDDKGRITSIIAHCDSISVGQGAFEAAVKRFPNQEITLRSGCRLISRHYPPGTKTG